MTDKNNVILNRIVSFLAGGLLVFAVMSFTVVNNVKDQNTKLTSDLDASMYEAGRLLADAKAQFAEGNFTKAKLSLTNLQEKQPGSSEAAEGRMLLPEIDTAQAAMEMKWEAALPEIQSNWKNAMAAELRAASDADRLKLENKMEDTINQAWEKAKTKVKTDWESGI